jgi:hypothetical protein
MPPSVRPAVALLCLAALAALMPAALAQQARPQDPPPRVYLDCPGHCDTDFLRTEIAFVDWVRERQDADVHVIVSTQATGAGGSEYTLRFVGLRAFVGADDEVRFVAPPAESADRVRRTMARHLAGALVRYAMRTAAADRLEIRYGAAEPTAAPEAPARDPWDNWVFRTRLSSFFNGESSYSSLNLNGNVSASRTTEAWKTSLSVSTFYARNEFDLGPAGRSVSDSRSHSANALVVRSVTGRLSAGGRASAMHSTFENKDLALRLGPAVEYNLFPYAESTRRQLTFQYSVGANRVSYIEETIFDRTSETLLDHALRVGLGLRQPWGMVNTSLEGSHYLHDPSRYRLSLGGGVDLRLVRGLSLNVGGSAARVRDQLHLQKGSLTEEQILLRLRQLETSYFYFGSVGLTYSFGSIFNPVVNPHFGGSTGGVTIIM